MKKSNYENSNSDQVGILSSQLEMLVNNSVWDNVNKDGIIRTAKQIKGIFNSPKTENDPKQVKKFIDILTKAKIKAVMGNDPEYYDICSKLDTIISNVSKYNGGENE